jgi:CBS domain-containing protein
MPYQVQQILEGKSAPISIEKDEPVSKALTIMAEQDYSQLPVYSSIDPDYPKWLITYEGILRGIRNLKAKIDDLRVRDVMVPALIYYAEDDLFDIIDRLKDTNAVLVMHSQIPELAGIVTSYDTMEYFRNQTENLMRVADIEMMVKEFIQAAYQKDSGEVDETKLDEAIARVINGHDGGKKKTFADLSLSEYNSLLTLKDTWPFFSPIFCISRESVIQLLNGIREIRNTLAHFRGDLTPEQRDLLKFGTEWLSKCQEEYQAQKQEQERIKILSLLNEQPEKGTAQPAEALQNQVSEKEIGYDFTVAEGMDSGGRYAALADYLQNQPGRIEQVVLTFNQIEEIINSDLPLSARKYKAWWANDSIEHTHSQLWLDAGWRTTYINLTEGRVTFTRIKDREKAYIDFFTRLLDDLRKKAAFPIRDVSPDGSSWIIIQSIPKDGPNYGVFDFSFTRRKQLRVELYLDLGNQAQTKTLFDLLFAQREQIEAKLGQPVQWERMDNRQASRIALYHDGQITEGKNFTELRKWAVDTMAVFYTVLAELGEITIHKVIR